MFVGRRLDGTIYGVWSCKQPQDADHLGIEELPDDNAEVVAFLKAIVSPKQETVADLRAVLVQKGIITNQDVTLKNGT